MDAKSEQNGHVVRIHDGTRLTGVQWRPRPKKDVQKASSPKMFAQSAFFGYGRLVQAFMALPILATSCKS